MTSFHSHYHLLRWTGEEEARRQYVPFSRCNGNQLSSSRIPVRPRGEGKRKTGRKRCWTPYTGKKRARGKELTGIFHMFLYYLNLLQNVSSYLKREEKFGKRLIFVVLCKQILKWFVRQKKKWRTCFPSDISQVPGSLQDIWHVAIALQWFSTCE